MKIGFNLPLVCSRCQEESNKKATLKEISWQQTAAKEQKSKTTPKGTAAEQRIVASRKEIVLMMAALSLWNTYEGRFQHTRTILCLYMNIKKVPNVSEPSSCHLEKVERKAKKCCHSHLLQTSKAKKWICTGCFASGCRIIKKCIMHLCNR